MMEKHKCKLCFRNFPNGRALGGHMRSHMMNSKANLSPPSPPPIQLSFEAESSPSPSSSSFEEEEKGLSYGLRENPKKSFRFADPEFADTGSVILQDRESETESSKNPTRRRSKRTWRLSSLDHHQPLKKIKFSIPCNKNESASSASDTTTEEDVAFCLMMLSRDKWKRVPYHNIEQEQELLEDKYEEQQSDDDDDQDEDEDEDDEEDDSEGYEEINKSLKTTTTTRIRGRYKCETCNKVFKSYQALGGHRASHKKIKFDHHEPELEHNNGEAASPSVPIIVEKKIHECPVCFRVFSSGQALGGHKRTHVIGSTITTTTAATTAIAEIPTTRVRSSTKLGGETLIDLNLPAPVDYDDLSQIEDSAVSDAEFVKPH